MRRARDRWPTSHHQADPGRDRSRVGGLVQRVQRPQRHRQRDRAQVGVLQPVAAGPSPGKCLAVAATPAFCCAVMNAGAEPGHRRGVAGVSERWYWSRKSPGRPVHVQHGCQVDVMPGAPQAAPGAGAGQHVPVPGRGRTGRSASPRAPGHRAGGAPRPPSWSVSMSSGARTGAVGCRWLAIVRVDDRANLGQARDVTAEEDDTRGFTLTDLCQQAGRRRAAWS